MAGRFSVEGTFRVVDRMTRPIRRLSRRMARFHEGVGRGFRGLREAAGHLRTGFLAVGAAIATVTAAAVAGLRRVIDTGMEFDQRITAAAAKFPGQIRRGSEAFEALEDAAQDVGRNTEFSASQAAEALDFLAMAGFGADQAISALPGVVDLATAAQMDLGQATDIASDSLGAFGLMTDDAAQLGQNLTRVNDVLARTSTSANTTVEQMFEAIRTGGPVAHSAGASVETFSGLVGQMAGAGIKGAEAGTALRNIFLRLQAPAAAGRRALRRLGITTTDSAGNMRDINAILGDLGRSLDGMGTAQRARALSDIFGARAVTSANVLLEAGEDQLNEYRASLESAEGAASDMANTMRDTAGGDMASLNSAVEGLQLAIWDLVRGPLRSVVQALTGWVRANQDAIAGGLRQFVDFLRRNQDTIREWGIAIGIVLAVVVGLFVMFAAAVMAAILLVPAIIAGIIVAIRALWDWVSGFASGAAEAVVGFLRAAWERISGFFRGALEFVVGLFVILRELVRPYLQPVINAIGRAADWVRERWAPIGAWFSGLWSGISGAARGAWNRLMAIAGGFVARLRAIWTPIQRFFADLWNGIVQGFQEAFGGIVGRIGSVIDQIRGVGRAEMEGGSREGTAAGIASPQVVTQGEQVGRTISETTNTDRSEVTIRPAEGAQAEVTRRSRGGGVRIEQQPSGAF